MATMHDVLRTLVRGDSLALNSARWVAEAIAAIDADEAARRPAPQPASSPAPTEVAK